jgi:DNA repair photolyase
MNNALTYTPKFALKNLGTHACNPAISCPGEEACLYCYVPSGPVSWKAPEIRKGEMVVRDPDAWLARLRRQAAQNRIKGTAILSTTTDPFNIDLLAITFEAVFILLRAGWQVRIITKKLGNLSRYNIPLLFRLEKNPDYKKRIIFNISLGCNNIKWCSLVEPGADSPFERLQQMGELIQRGFQVAVMACPIPPDHYHNTFKAYGYLLKMAEAVYCEIMNPRGHAYKKIGELFPEILTMQDPAERSAQSLQLIQAANGLIDAGMVAPEAMNVLAYRKELLPQDYEKAKHYQGVKWL